MDIRAIALDIDGTLTDDAKNITPRTREALLRAQDKGIELVLASGRPVSGLTRYADELRLRERGGLMVSFNGGAVTDARTDEVLDRTELTADECRRVVEHLRGFDVVPMLYEGPYLICADPYDAWIRQGGRCVDIVRFESRTCGLRVREEDLLAWSDHSTAKVLCAASDTYLADRWRDLAAPFEHELSCVFTSPVYFEFCPAGVNKGAALRRALPRIGVQMSQLLAFGDSGNDVEMLREAGLGVAMGNAIPQALEAADRTTLTNNEDGIAAVLEELGI